jgi:hypothetical protein
VTSPHAHFVSFVENKPTNTHKMRITISNNNNSKTKSNHHNIRELSWKSYNFHMHKERGWRRETSRA